MIGLRQIGAPLAQLFRRAGVATDDRSARALALADTLLTSRGEVSGTATATALARLYTELASPERRQFLAALVEKFGPPGQSLRAAAEAYLRSPGPAEAAALAVAAEPLRQELLRRLNTAPSGTALIVEMREHVLELERGQPALQPLAADLKHLLSSWFNRGFLELRQLDWRSPAAVLEKLIRYEAVHAIGSWDELRMRVEGRRRCFGFFHPALPDEPLIFVEVALTDSISTCIQPLLAADTEHRPPPTTAMFYSISNCQPGLRGISFGNFLIKQLVTDLTAEFPSLRQFATLSPIPGFRRWLEQLPPGDIDSAVRAALRSDATPDDELREPLLRLCASYLTGGSPAGTGRGTSDSVARFHLANGARVEQINWQADPSAKGHRESLGMMVNYRYRLRDIESNHEAFAGDGRVIASAAVTSLARK